MLNRRGANALYVEVKEGEEGVLIVRESASPKAIMEELHHLEEHRLIGFRKLTTEDILRMENKAQEALLAYGKLKGWTKAELEALEQNQKYWQENQERYKTHPEEVEEEVNVLMNKDGSNKNPNKFNSSEETKRGNLEHENTNKSNSTELHIQFKKGEKRITFDKDGNMIIDNSKASKNLKEKVYEKLDLSHTNRGHGPEKSSIEVANEAKNFDPQKGHSGIGSKFSTEQILIEASIEAQNRFIDKNSGKLFNESKSVYEFEPLNNWPNDWAELYYNKIVLPDNAPILKRAPFNFEEILQVNPNKIRVVFGKNNKVKTIYAIYGQ